MSQESADEKLARLMQKSAPSVAAHKPVAAKKKIKLSFSLKFLNTLLILVALMCLLYWVYEMKSGSDWVSQPVSFPTENKADQALSDVALPVTPSANYYLQQVNGRNIFKPYAPKAAQKAPAQGLAQRMAKYKLVGIAWLDLPETATVMLENTQNHETYFLKQGEQLESVTVKTIYTDRAVFSHENEETTIKL